VLIRVRNFKDSRHMCECKQLVQDGFVAEVETATSRSHIWRLDTPFRV